MNERLVPHNGINRMEAKSLTEVFEALDAMELKEEDVVMYDLDGTVRRESWPRADVFAESDEGKLIGLRDKALRWGVQHGMGIRKPDFVDPKIIENIGKYQCRKAIVTDNTIGGHWVSQFLNEEGERWFELAGKSRIQVFAQDTIHVDRNIEKTSFEILKERNEYLLSLLYQLGAQFGLGIAEKLHIFEKLHLKTVTAPDYRYKSMIGDGKKGVADINAWINENSKTNSVGRIIMVGDEESDFEFFQEVVNKLRESEHSGFEAYYFDVSFNS